MVHRHYNRTGCGAHAPFGQKSIGACAQERQHLYANDRVSVILEFGLTQILIYIEPYPLRNEADHYRDIAIEFAKMLVRGATEDNLQEFDIRIYGNWETLTRIQEATIAAKRFLLWPERDETEFFRAGLDDWTTGGIEGWADLLRVWFKIISGFSCPCEMSGDASDVCDGDPGRRACDGFFPVF